MSQLAVPLVVGTFVGRLRDALARRRSDARQRSNARNVLPSLYQRHPEAARVPQRRVGLRSVPLDAIVGTMRHPSQNSVDFLPLPKLRGENWRARWQRITRATDRLAMLPPVDLMQVGEEYYVADGHNRVAAARRVGAVEIDADVTQLLVPGVTRPEQQAFDASSVYGAGEVRQAASGRLTRTLEQRTSGDQLSRHDLLRKPDEGPR
ncbi:MAG TPA: hypothetical protein VLA59_09145 [Patescibacteria group bacterium]|nr:hypothetical protein [Patescibacteria group bacterium]